MSANFLRMTQGRPRPWHQTHQHDCHITALPVILRARDAINHVQWRHRRLGERDADRRRYAITLWNGTQAVREAVTWAPPAKQCFTAQRHLNPYVTVRGYTVVIAASTPAMETITRTLQSVRIHAVEKSFLKVHSAENNLYWWFITNVPVVGPKQSVCLKKKKNQPSLRSQGRWPQAVTMSQPCFCGAVGCKQRAKYAIFQRAASCFAEICDNKTTKPTTALKPKNRL